MSQLQLSKWRLALNSLFHFWRPNLAVVFGVMVATAVLTGALVVGDSMRTSLKQLTLDRLGEIDEILVSDGFFRAELAREIKSGEKFRAEYDTSLPVVLFPNGSVEVERDGGFQRASGINVFGVTPDFWQLGSLEVDASALVDNKIIINQALADELGIEAVGRESETQESLTLRIPKPSQLPSDSALGKQDDLVEAIVDRQVLQVVPNESLGRFSLHPSQTTAPNLFLPIEVVQQALRRGALSYKGDIPLANVVLLSYAKGVSPYAVDTGEMAKTIQPRLIDHGLSLKRITRQFPEQGEVGEAKTVFDYWSLVTDRLVLSDQATQSIEKAVPSAKPVFTYLANDIRKPDTDSGVPFSMVAAIDFDDAFALPAVDGAGPIRKLSDDEIVLNEWAANDLNAEIGDTIELVYFEPETTHGAQVEATVQLKLAGIAKLTEPSEPFDIRRGKVVPNQFDKRPTTANDPDLTPEVPGLTDAATIESWDLPFSTKNRIRSQDDEYWNYHRTTPKAFVSLATGKKLWGSRFGETTSYRIPTAAGSDTEIIEKLEAQFQADDAKLGFTLVPIKRNGLQASSGSTPFDALFLGLSMFVIAAALILVSLLFRLGLQSRAGELGLFKAVGFPANSILGIWLREMLLVCGLGAALGIVGGVGYAALMILGLKTWWVGAISEPFIELNVGPLFLGIGLLSGVAICIFTIWWSLRRTRNEPVRNLLGGELESGSKTRKQLGGWIAWVLAAVAIGLSIFASTQNGDAQAGAFMGSGFLILFAILVALYRWLSAPTGTGKVAGLSLNRLATMNAKRNPLRSTLTIGLVASASFLIVAVSSFRLAPSDRGTGGFDFIATSSQPVFGNLNTTEVQNKLLGAESSYPVDAVVRAFRYKPGEDASCNNVYQSSQPQVLGVTDEFINSFDDPEQISFAFAGSAAETEAETANPWQLLKKDKADGAIPCILDKNTAFYSLKIFSIGQRFTADYDSGESVTFLVVGFLDNTILQGSMICSEENFVSAFPNIGGYRYFLVRDGGTESAIPILEDRLSDQGFDATSAPRRLAEFMQVQNTYLSTFQALGALGLLLGTFGLAAVQIRNVVQRQGELGLMRAVGFGPGRLAWMVLVENVFLLLVGLASGIVAASCATIPHFLLGNANVPWLELAVMFGVIVVVGLIVSWLASTRINRLPLLASLRQV